MRKWIVVFFVSCIFLVLGNIRVEAGEIHSREIFSLEEPTWIFKSGMGRGKHHDRQDLGFILKENTKLKVRQVNVNFKGSFNFAVAWR
ncbi:hypothetical protein [Listeria riparia]|uniref:Metallprotease, enhancin family protein n=1 Tax=Listeria riparia FSL S10-1204 TaxID=1265816 RepID=W7DA77_9LIST|nr:hypothetical protein [Listeria riparia]EUJ45955.1 metallprotease, enhancin family protein [Listeria riparia FSL S10-1204]